MKSESSPPVRWLPGQTALGRVLWGLVVLAMLVALFYLEETWRGKRAWERCRAAMLGQGVRFDFGAYVPRPVPDESNFAMTPFLAPLYDFIPGTQTHRDTNADKRIVERNDGPIELAKKWGFQINGENAGRWEKSQTTDLLALLGTYDSFAPPAEPDMDRPARPTNQTQAAAMLLDIFQRTYDPVLEELREASRRPYCRFNVPYDTVPVVGILLPHLAIMKSIVQKVSWRASAELALGKTNEAFADLLLGLYLSDSIKDEPFLISHLVHIA